MYRVLRSLENFTARVQLSNISANDTYAFNTYALQLHDINVDSFTGQNFSVNLGSVEEARNRTLEMNSDALTNMLSEDATVYVTIPASLFMEGMETQRLSYSVFLRDRLFQSVNNTVIVGSVILAVTAQNGQAGEDASLTIGFRAAMVGNIYN